MKDIMLLRTGSVGTVTAAERGAQAAPRAPFVYAAHGAKTAALNGDTLTYDTTAMPAVVFTGPQTFDKDVSRLSCCAG